MKSNGRDSYLRKPLFAAVFWLSALLLTLALSAWGIFTRSQHEEVFVKAQPRPMLPFRWMAAVPELNFSPSTIRLTGTDFSLHGWRGGQFDAFIFAAEPLHEATESFSDLNLSSDDEMRLNAHFHILKTPTWRWLSFGQSVLILASYSRFSNNDTNREYGYAYITGKNGGKFQIERNGKDCGVGCAGKFADFHGGIHPTNPPKFVGPGAGGVNRITVTATAQGSTTFRTSYRTLKGSK